MHIKEIAEHALKLLKTGERCDIYREAELLAKHVLAQESDPSVAVPVATTHVVAMKAVHSRYEFLLELMDSAGPKARERLERSLDAQIAKRDSRVVRLN